MSALAAARARLVAALAAVEAGLPGSLEQAEIAREALAAAEAR